MEEHPLLPHELELLVHRFGVDAEQLGVELDEPIYEACFCCKSFFEKKDQVVKMPYCGHRAHVNCLKSQPKCYCLYCGNGIRSSLFAFIRSFRFSDLAKKNVEKQEIEEEERRKTGVSKTNVTQESLTNGVVE